MSFRLRFQQLHDLRRRIGAFRTLVFLARRLTGWRPPVNTGARFADSDVSRIYGYLFDVVPTDAQIQRPGPPGTINWYIPDFGPGSGGHLNILRFARLLNAYGFQSRFVLVGSSQIWNAQDLKRALSNFDEGTFDSFIGAKSALPAEFHLATGWQTVSSLPAAKEGVRLGYFVQDYEPAFYGAGTMRTLAEQTYSPDLPAVTAGSWLAKKLHDEHGVPTVATGFAADLNHYRQRFREAKDRVRVLFYARPPTERRCFGLGMLALEEVYRRRPDVEFVLVGWDIPRSNASFPFLNAGSVAIAELPQLYSDVDAALVLSATNLSLLPLEIMACGTPVVSNGGPHVEWLLGDANTFLSASSPSGLADAIIAAITPGEERTRKIAAATSLVRSQSWDSHAQTVATWLESLRQV